MGTGMVASSSTFRTHLGMVIRDLSCLLHAALHGTEALVYNDYLRGAAASTCLAIILGGLPAVYPGFSTRQWCQCSSRISAVTDFGRGRALNNRE